jgi:hypothetical protein
MDIRKIIEKWPEESMEAAQLVIDKYGDPDEFTDSVLIWNHVGPWKRMVAYRDFDSHNFPYPHNDSVESFIDYDVPIDKFDDLAEFDGSVVANRTRGELSARCHDEEANNLALNLADDIVHGRKTVREARDYYAYEFLSYREKKPTPYMNGLRFSSAGKADPDMPLLSDEQIRAAIEEGQNKAKGHAHQ